MRSRNPSRFTLILCLSAAPILAQAYETDFESITAAAGGTLLSGQDGWYLPAVAGSTDWNAYTYANNQYNVPQNLLGSSQFIAGRSTGTLLARAQHPFPFTAAVPWRFSVDLSCKFVGTLPAVDNLGSFSTQPSATNRFFIMLARWDANNTTATLWSADYNYFDTTGTSITGSVPDPNFQNLAVDHWYRWETVFDLASNAILELRITDLTTFVTTSYVPSGWYLAGGSASTLPLPTDFRCFAGGGDGNVVAVDNVSVAPAAIYAPFGAGCSGTAGVPALGATLGTRPELGTTFTALLSNMPPAGGFALLLTGFSDTSFPPFTLPLDLTPFGLPGCTLLTDTFANAFVLNSGGTGNWSLALPNFAGYLGIGFFQQAFVYDPTVNVPGFTVTNGCRAVLGR